MWHLSTAAHLTTICRLCTIFCCKPLIYIFLVNRHVTAILRASTNSEPFLTYPRLNVSQVGWLGVSEYNWWACALPGEVLTKGKGPFGQLGLPLNLPLNPGLAGFGLAVWVGFFLVAAIGYVPFLIVKLLCIASKPFLPSFLYSVLHSWNYALLPSLLLLIALRWATLYPTRYCIKFCSGGFALVVWMGFFLVHAIGYDTLPSKPWFWPSQLSAPHCSHWVAMLATDITAMFSSIVQWCTT